MRKLFQLTIISFAILLLMLLSLGCNGNAEQISSPEDIIGKNIGALVGTPSMQLADEWGTAVQFYSAADMMRALRMEAIDAAIMESTTAEELVSETTGVAILAEPLAEYELRFAVPLENTGLLDAVNTALEELERNGTLRGLTNKYFARGNFIYEKPEDMPQISGSLTIALVPDSPPFSFRDEEGNFIGMDVDVAIAVSHRLGVTLEVFEYESSELVTAVLHGRVDMALGWRPGEEEGVVNTSVPYAKAVHVVIVRR